jgi:hypothetical protein
MQQQPRPMQQPQAPAPPVGKPKEATPHEKEVFEQMLEDLIGTRGAYLLDEKLTILGKVPLSELQGTIKSLRSGIYAVVLDGIIDKDLLMIVERANVSFLVAMDTKIKSQGRVNVLISDDL